MKLVPIEHNNQRILTSSQVAEGFGTDVDNIKKELQQELKQIY